MLRAAQNPLYRKPGFAIPGSMYHRAFIWTWGGTACVLIPVIPVWRDRGHGLHFTIYHVYDYCSIEVMDTI